MPEPDNNQKRFDQQVEDDIKKKIQDDVDTKSKKTDEETPDDDTDVKKRKKPVDTTSKKTDTKDDTDDSDDSDDPGDETKLYDAVLSKIIEDEFDGDESKRSEAESIANVAIKTFNGDPIKAAKSYKSLWDKTHGIQNVINSNPFIEKLINEAKQGKVIDENYAKSLLGTATSEDADQPDNKKEKSTDKLDDDDFDLDKFSADDLIEAGSLDKTKFEAATSADKRDMLEKARIRHAYKVLPQKMAERSVRLAKEEEKKLTQKEKRDNALQTNQKRLEDDLLRVSTKYGLDFEGNPEHAQLWKDIHDKAWRVPDLDDNSGLLVAENAVEEAVKHVFRKNGMNLPNAEVITDDSDKKPEHKVDRMSSGSADAMRRILSSTEGFQGLAGKRKESRDNKKKTGSSLDDKVNERVNENLQRSFGNSHMLSGIRKTDNKKQ